MSKEQNVHGLFLNVNKLIKSDAKQPVLFVQGKVCEPFEYLCGNCGQLRLALVTTNKCNACGSSDIIIGNIGTLERIDDG
jgi:hypothetical protein